MVRSGSYPLISGNCKQESFAKLMANPMAKFPCLDEERDSLFPCREIHHISLETRLGNKEWARVNELCKPGKKISQQQLAVTLGRGRGYGGRVEGGRTAKSNP